MTCVVWLLIELDTFVTISMNRTVVDFATLQGIQTMILSHINNLGFNTTNSTLSYDSINTVPGHSLQSNRWCIDWHWPDGSSYPPNVYMNLWAFPHPRKLKVSNIQTPFFHEAGLQHKASSPDNMAMERFNEGTDNILMYFNKTYYLFRTM